VSSREDGDGQRNVTAGRVSFIGAGPGAADLITVRGARRLAEADIVLWSASLVTLECIREHSRPDAEVIDSSRLTHEEALEIYRRAAARRLRVARLYSGDPTLWGTVQEQYDACRRLGLEVEIVPGVSVVSAAAAAVGRELTAAEIAQSVVLTRLEGSTTVASEGERVRELARHGTTMAVFLSASRTGQLVEELRAGGYPDDTPVVVASKVSWPDEMLLSTTLGELEQTVKAHKLWRHTLFLVGRALQAGGTRSRSYRKVDSPPRRTSRSEWSGRSRSGSAARRSSGGTARSDSADQVVVPRPAPSETTGTTVSARRPGQPDPAVAWWAVHDWQETARNRPAGTRSRGARRAGQDEDLFASERTVEAQHDTTSAGRPQETPVTGVEPSTRQSNRVAAAASATAQVTVRVDELPAPGEPEPEEWTVAPPRSADDATVATGAGEGVFPELAAEPAPAAVEHRGTGRSEGLVPVPDVTEQTVQQETLPGVGEAPTSGKGRKKTTGVTSRRGGRKKTQATDAQDDAAPARSTRGRRRRSTD